MAGVNFAKVMVIIGDQVLGDKQEISCFVAEIFVGGLTFCFIDQNKRCKQKMGLIKLVFYLKTKHLKTGVI